MNAPQMHDVWLHLEAVSPTLYTVTRTAANGSGAIGSPKTFFSWDEAAQKLRQAGLKDDEIASIGDELKTNHVTIRGPVQMTAQQASVLGILNLPA